MCDLCLAITLMRRSVTPDDESVSRVSYRKPTVATVLRGYGGWPGRATSVSTANCWSISAVTDSSLRPAKGLW